MTQHFLYKLLPPRPDFAFTMTPEEAAVMAEHGRYWAGRLAGGDVVVYGPVAEPTGAWGMAVVEAEDVEAVHRVRDGDPAVTSGTCTAEVHPMISAFVRPRPGPTPAS
ncbi:YciI family protein [Geodermatophilus sp. SYSU D00815]